MASKNNNIRREGADAYPGGICQYRINYKIDLWREGYESERLDQEKQKIKDDEAEENRIKWIDPEDDLFESIRQIQEILDCNFNLEDL